MVFGSTHQLKIKKVKKKNVVKVGPPLKKLSGSAHECRVFAIFSCKMAGNALSMKTSVQCTELCHVCLCTVAVRLKMLHHLEQVITLNFMYTQKKTTEGYLDSVPSLTFNVIQTKLIMHALYSSIYLQSKLMKTLLQQHNGKCIRRFGGIYACCRYFIDRKW